MSRIRRGAWLRSIQTLYDGGAIGALGDGELLGIFLGRGAASGTAFEAIVARHAAMVLDVCRSIAGSEADAEDAFQATFLVLACRASTVRDRGSLGPWLFGVARRLAMRARSDAARRRSSERRAAGLRPASYGPAEPDEAAAALIEEVDRLPAKYRDPVILCQLQGMTYEAAARRLGCPLGTLSIRLRRAKERLRRNLEDRGVRGPAALVHLPGPAVPKALTASAARLATLAAAAFGPDVPAPILSLTRGALMTMRIRRLARISAAYLALAAGAWAGLEAASNDAPQAAPQAAEARKSTRYQLTGRVLQEDGTPAPGAVIQVLTYDLALRKTIIKEARSGPDGMYSLDLPPGHFDFGAFIPPPGCRDLKHTTTGLQPMALSDAQPTIRKDFQVARGVAWDFRLVRGERPAGRVGVGAEPVSGRNSAYVVTDADGLARLGLWSGQGEARLFTSVMQPQSRPARCSIRWDDGFRPGAVRSVARLDGTLDRYWITDVDGRSAMLEANAGDRFDPKMEGGLLVVRVDLPEDAKETLPAVEGSIVGEGGAPVAGARVDVLYVNGNSSSMADCEGSSATADGQGRYRLDKIPASSWTGRPTALRLVVTKDGFAGLDSEPIPVDGRGPKTIPPIALKPSCSVTGVVLDADGRPAQGARIEPAGTFSARARCTWTDAEGRFTVVGLPEEPTPLNIVYGDLRANVEESNAARAPWPIQVRLERK